MRDLVITRGLLILMGLLTGQGAFAVERIIVHDESTREVHTYEQGWRFSKNDFTLEPFANLGSKTPHRLSIWMASPTARRLPYQQTTTEKDAYTYHVENLSDAIALKKYLKEIKEIEIYAKQSGSNRFEITRLVIRD